MSILSLSPTKPFPSHGLTLLVYNCLSRPKDLAMCNVQSKAEMGTHALHAPQRICKACKEKKCELEKMQGQHFKRIRCEGKKMWKKVSQRNSLTQLYQCKGITHLNRCNRCSNCFNSSMFWARKANIYQAFERRGSAFCSLHRSQLQSFFVALMILALQFHKRWGLFLPKALLMAHGSSRIKSVQAGSSRFKSSK